ncbi:unnamed protein product [Cochlearia groenlandica]
MLSSSSTFFAPSFLSSSSSFSPPPSRAPHRISPPSYLSAATASSYTFTDDPPTRLTKISRRTASLYEILEIPVVSTRKEIKSAYRRLARIFHPDAAAGNGRNSSSSSSATEDFVKIHTAYCTLSDPEKRAVYDRMILNRRIRPLSGGGVGGYGGGNWETDQCW